MFMSQRQSWSRVLWPDGQSWRGGRREGMAGCEGIIIQAQTEILHKHTHTHTHTHTHCMQPVKWSQSHRWGSFTGLSDRPHINKICRGELLDSLDVLVPLLVLSETGGHGVLPSSSPLGRSLRTQTQVQGYGQCAGFRARERSHA